MCYEGGRPFGMSAVQEFREKGFLAPVPVIGRWRAHRWIKRLRDCPRPKEWSKARAVHCPVYAQLAQHPRIIATVTQLLGENVILWGASLVRRRPSEDHPWHSDVETAYGEGNTVSVWIPLSNIGRKSGLQLVSGSHLFGASVQELRYRGDVDRSDISNGQILDWARAYSPKSEIIQPDLRVGDAVFFDGRVWHSSINHARSASRVALLLQYATPEVPIRVCESACISPYTRIDVPGPGCILVSGRNSSHVNTVIRRHAAGEPMKRKKRFAFMPTVIKQVELPLEEHREEGRQSCQLGGGITPTVDRMNCHMSILSAGVMPHEPHSHLDEELLIMLSGEADLVMVPERITGKQERYRLEAGSLVFYPAFFTHTIHNRGSEPATYLMFKWHAAVPSRADSQAGVYQYAFPELSVDNRHEKPWESRKVLDFPTRHLKRLHCHVSLLQPGAGYDPHRDRYDVAILLLQGTVETLGRKVEPFSLIYYSAGEVHGMRNIGNSPACYLVFEFHPGPAGNRWVRTAMQLRRILRSPPRQIPGALAVFAAVRSEAIRKRALR